MAENSKKPLRVFIFDGARLRSHLFFRYMSTHPAFHPIYHPFLMAGMFGPENIAKRFTLSAARQEEVAKRPRLPGDDATFDSETAKFTKGIEEAEKEGKVAIANEHWFNVLKQDLVVKFVRKEIDDSSALGTNPTVIPDDILGSLTPIILIRHPALTIDSVMRAVLASGPTRPGDDDFPLRTLNEPLRTLFDWYREQGEPPIVVDGEDILWRTEEVARGLCGKLEIDASGLRDQWEPVSKEDIGKMNPIMVRLTKDILESKGINRPDVKPAEPSIEAYYQKWKTEYGNEYAGLLKEYAEENMPHYEYLKQFKV